MGSPVSQHRVSTGEFAAAGALVFAAFAVVWAVLGAAAVPCSSFVQFFPLVLALSAATAARAVGFLALAQFCGAFSILLLLSPPDTDFMRLWLCTSNSMDPSAGRYLSDWGIRSVWAISIAHVLSRLPYSSSQIFVPVAGVFALGVAAANHFVAWVTRDALGAPFHIGYFEIGFLVSLGVANVLAQAGGWVGRRVGPLHASAWIVMALGMAAVTVSWSALDSRETVKRGHLAQTYLEQLQKEILDKNKQLLGRAEEIARNGWGESRNRGVASKKLIVAGEDLYSILSVNPALRAFYRLDASGTVKDLYSLLLSPLNHNEADANRFEIAQAIQKRSSGSARILRVEDEALGLIRIPLPDGGTLAAVVDRRSLASTLIGNEAGPQVHLAVDDGLGPMFFGKQFALAPARAMVVPDPIVPWMIYVDPDSPRFVADLGSRFPETFMVVGIAFTLLITLLVHYLEILRFQTESARRANEELRLSEDQLQARALELIEARETAVHASRMKTQFLAHLSHEIRTPLNAIVSAVELLSESVRGAREKSHATTAVSAAELVVELLNETLDIARIEGGNIDIQPVVFAPRQLVDACCGLFSVQAKKRGIRVQSKIGKDVPEWMESDIRRVRQVLTNLLSNSLKFTRHGQVNLEVDVEQARDGACVLRFVVQDTGVGIPGDEIPKLFHPFTRGSSYDGTEAPGSGLGLAISRQLVERLNAGRLPASIPDGIHVQSVVGQGTRFWFFLSVAKFGKNTKGITKRSRPKPKAGTRVLLVEDNEISRKVTTQRLESLGYRITAVASGEDAFDSYRAKRVDVILMDCHLPGETGYQTARRVREYEAHEGLQPSVIIALTASAFSEDKARCAQAGMDDYLSKPFRSDTLSEKIVEHLGTRTAKSSGAKKMRPEVTRLARKASKGFAEELFKIFTTDVPMRLWSLHRARKEMRYTDLAEAAHALKGMVADVGCEEMARACTRIETAVREKNTRVILEQIQLLESEYRSRVTDWRRELKPKRKRAA